MDKGDKGKYVLYTAIIAALATASVPVLSHYFPPAPEKPPAHLEVQQPARAEPSPQPQPQQMPVITPKQRPAPGNSGMIQPKQSASLPRPEPSTEELFSKAKEATRVRDYSEALSDYQNLIVKEPHNVTWHACLAELAVQKGDVHLAETEFKSAGEDGDQVMSLVSDRVKLAEKSIKWEAQFRDGDDVSDSDYDEAVALSNLEIPGVDSMQKRVCRAVIRKANIQKGIGKENETSGMVSETWAQRAERCTVGYMSGGIGLRDCKY